MSEDPPIRPMRPAEAEHVSAIIAAAIRSGFSGHYPPDVIEATIVGNSPQAVRDHAPDQTDYVYLQDGRIAAMIGLKRSEIGHLFVDPGYAGRGIGRRLVAFAADRSRRAGHADMTVLSSRNAVGFYERCGFLAEGEGSFDVGPGLPLTYVRMRAPLAAV